MKLSNFLYSLVLGIFLFQNCSNEARFSQEEVGSSGLEVNEQLNEQLGNSEEQDLGVIEKLCQGQTQQTRVVNIQFPKPDKTCEWGVGGNLSELNQYFRARIEQKRSLGLPKGAVICDATFDFVQQDFLYDDHFMLLFNDHVIASSYDFKSQLTPANFGLLKYDWPSMVGMYWDGNKETIFCPQIPGGQSQCSFPGHDQQGVINLDYSPSFIKSIMSNGVPSDHNFKMVSIGDNDSQDCEHSDVEFDVTVRFVISQ